LTLDDYKLVFSTISFILILLCTAPIINSIIPENKETYVVMAILGPQRTADQYYPMNNPNIELRTPLNWHLFLYNHMNRTQYILVKVKLLNSTLQSPNSSLGIPSPEFSIIEITRFLTVNETWIHPIYWQISEVTVNEDTVVLNEVIINDSPIQVNTIATNGKNFRLVFELWLFNERSQEFNFTQTYLGKETCVWNQIWFNVTRSL
jgi:hypothetical protein